MGRVPHAALMGTKAVRGFQTGDVRAEVPKGNTAVAVRVSGSFIVQTPTGVVQGINALYCTIIHRADGCKYQKVAPPSRPLRAGFPARKS
jgi:hypothetical protein